MHCFVSVFLCMVGIVETILIYIKQFYLNYIYFQITATCDDIQLMEKYRENKKSN